MNPFKLIARDAHSKARAGVLKTPHGEIQTPVFMPVGTQATVKMLDSKEVESMDYKIILANTYHLFLRPGVDILMKAGGLHSFMAWPRAILTDSGGYQVFSLATRCKLSEEGVEFSSHVDGERRLLTPEITTEFQLNIGSDIAMCLDDCPPYPTLKSDAEKSLAQTLRWAKRCRTSYDRWLEEKKLSNENPVPMVFGISQGAGFEDLRNESTQKMVEIGFPGYAIGGLGLGEPRGLTWSLAEASLKSMPDDAPHYLMGFGQPEDMWEGVERGIDMFDCVLPTRNARNGQALTSIGRVQVTNSENRENFRPLDEDCSCLTCKDYTRAYLCHLFRAGESLGPKLVTLHNLWFMVRLLRIIRESIIAGKFLDAKKEFFSRFQTTKNNFVSK